MGKHNAAYNLHSTDVQLADPGASGTITVERNPAYVGLVSATAETRTLANPTIAGVKLTVQFMTDGGDVTFTVTDGFDLDGNTAITFADAGQVAVFESYWTGSAYRWRLTYTDAAGAGARRAEILAATATLTAADHGKTFFLNLVGGFDVVLPAPALGLKFKFVVMTSPTTAYTVSTSASANILCGQVLTLDVNSATDPDFTATADQDRLTFVASKAVKGDWAEFECDGTSWYVRASASVFDGITIDQVG